MAKVSFFDAMEPEADLEEGDQVIGTMSEDLKRLCVVMNESYEKLKVVTEKVKNLTESIEKGKLPKSQQERLKREYFFCKNDYLAVNQLFLSSLYLEFEEILWKTTADRFWSSLHAEPAEMFGYSVGIRVNWRVVIIDQKSWLRKSIIGAVHKFFS